MSVQNEMKGAAPVGEVVLPELDENLIYAHDRLPIREAQLCQALIDLAIERRNWQLLREQLARDDRRMQGSPIDATCPACAAHPQEACKWEFGFDHNGEHEEFHVERTSVALIEKHFGKTLDAIRRRHGLEVAQAKVQGIREALDVVTRRISEEDVDAYTQGTMDAAKVIADLIPCASTAPADKEGA